MAKSDYFHWDEDLDLDLLLGEYTDQENVFDDEDSEFQVNESVGVKRRKTESKSTVKQDTINYKCPVCGKVLKTVSGFRGHTTRQHGLSNVKATDNRDGVTNQAEMQGTSPSTMDIHDIFEEAYKASLLQMKNDPLLQLTKWRGQLQQLNDIMNTQLVMDFFHNEFKGLFNVDINITMEKDREVLFTKVHRMRLSDSIQKEVIAIILSSGFDGNELHVNGFVQDFILELLSELLRCQVSKQVKLSEKEQQTFSDSDQKILFYITGYIIKALKKKYVKLTSQDKKDCLDNLRCKSSGSTFVTRYKSWTELQDRGGLECPCDDFYLLIREIENVVRKNTDTDLGANSLLKTKLKESILESFMVKHYSAILFDDMAASIGVTIVEDIINLFLTVRGYATARVKRNELIKAKKSTAKSKSSSSLRQSLKQVKN